MVNTVSVPETHPSANEEVIAKTPEEEPFLAFDVMIFPTERANSLSSLSGQVFDLYGECGDSLDSTACSGRSNRMTRGLSLTDKQKSAEYSTLNGTNLHKYQYVLPPSQRNEKPKKYHHKLSNSAITTSSTCSGKPTANIESENDTRLKLSVSSPNNNFDLFQKEQQIWQTQASLDLTKPLEPMVSNCNNSNNNTTNWTFSSANFSDVDKIAGAAFSSASNTEGLYEQGATQTQGLKPLNETSSNITTPNKPTRGKHLDLQPHPPANITSQQGLTTRHKAKSPEVHIKLENEQSEEIKVYEEPQVETHLETVPEKPVSISGQKRKAKANPNKNAASKSKKLGFTSSGYNGVCFNKRKGKWRARFNYNGTREFLGDFDTEEEAAIAFDKRIREVYPKQKQVEKLNFIDGVRNFFQNAKT